MLSAHAEAASLYRGTVPAYAVSHPQYCGSLLLYRESFPERREIASGYSEASAECPESVSEYGGKAPKYAAAP